MNRLILMVGLPRSGKTTAARRLGHPIVCPDAAPAITRKAAISPYQ